MMLRVALAFAVIVLVVLMARAAERDRIHRAYLYGFWRSTAEFAERSGATAWVHFERDAAYIVLDDGAGEPLANDSYAMSCRAHTSNVLGATQTYTVSFDREVGPVPSTLTLQIDPHAARATLCDSEGTCWLALEKPAALG